VIAMDADRVTVLTGGDTVGFPAVGNEPTRIVFVRNAIARKIDPPYPDPSSEVPDDSVDTDATDGTQSYNGHLNGHDGTLDASHSEDAESESEDTTS
jgi:hypothetical protein